MFVFAAFVRRGWENNYTNKDKCESHLFVAVFHKGVASLFFFWGGGGGHRQKDDGLMMLLFFHFLDILLHQVNRIDERIMHKSSTTKKVENNTIEN